MLFSLSFSPFLLWVCVCLFVFSSSSAVSSLSSSPLSLCFSLCLQCGLMTKHRLAQKLLDENAVEEKARNLSLLLSKGRPSADITAAAAIHPHELLPPLIDLLGTLSPAVDAYVSDTIARQTLALFPETWAKWIRALGSTTASAALLEELMSNDGKLTGEISLSSRSPCNSLGFGIRVHSMQTDRQRFESFSQPFILLFSTVRAIFLQ